MKEERTSGCQHTNYPPQFNFSKADFSAMYEGLKHIDWTDSYTINDSDNASEYFHTKLVEVMKKNVLERKKKKTERKYPTYPSWFSVTITNIKTIKEKYRSRLKRRNTPDLLNTYQDLRKKSKKLIREAYRQHVQEIEKKMKYDPNSFWKHINTKRADSNTPTIMRYLDQTIADPMTITEAFATHFSSVFGKRLTLADELSLSTCSSQKVVVKSISESDVSAAMACLKPKRSTGLDGIPQYVYRASRELLAKPLTYVYNVILRTNYVPRRYLLSKVTPISKENETQDISNH